MTDSVATKTDKRKRERRNTACVEVLAEENKGRLSGHIDGNENSKKEL